MRQHVGFLIAFCRSALPQSRAAKRTWTFALFPTSMLAIFSRPTRWVRTTAAAAAVKAGQFESTTPEDCAAMRAPLVQPERPSVGIM